MYRRQRAVGAGRELPTSTSPVVKMPQGVKVVNPMMGGEFDAPIDDDDDDDELNEPVMPKKEGQTALGESGEPAAEVRTATTCSLAFSCRSTVSAKRVSVDIRRGCALWWLRERQRCSSRSRLSSRSSSHRWQCSGCSASSATF